MSILSEKDIKLQRLKLQQLSDVSGGGNGVPEGDAEYLKAHGYHDIMVGTCFFCYRTALIGINPKAECMCGVCHATF